MKLPSSDTAKGIAVLAIVGVVAYALYRLVTAGSRVADTVAKSITKVKDAVVETAVGVKDAARGTWDSATLAVEKARTSSIGAMAPDPDEQNAAETARLRRQAGWITVATEEEAYTDLGLPTGMTTVSTTQVNTNDSLGMFAPTLTPVMQDSGDNSGLTAWKGDAP